MIINHWLKVKGVVLKQKQIKFVKCENFNFPIHSKLFQQSLKTSNKFESVCLKPITWACVITPLNIYYAVRYLLN
jgi:hypothetical protein